MNFRQIVGHEELISHFKSMIETDHVAHAYIIGGEAGGGRARWLIVLPKHCSVK